MPVSDRGERSDRSARDEIPPRPGRTLDLRHARRLAGRRPRRRLRSLPEKLRRHPARHQGDARARPVYGGLYNACEKAVKLAAGGTLDREQARNFFESNFKPVRILPELHTYGYYTGADGFYTGYYEAEVTGSRVKTEEYNVPLYGVPAKCRGQEEHGVRAIRPHRNRQRRARRQGPGDLLDQKSGRCLLRADPGLDARQARRRRIAAAQLHRQQRQALHAGRPAADRPRHLHARRHVDGQDPRIHGSQSGRGQGTAREEPLLCVLFRDAARPDRRMPRRAGHSADAVALDRGRSHRSTSTARRSGSTPNSRSPATSRTTRSSI